MPQNLQRCFLKKPETAPHRAAGWHALTQQRLQDVARQLNTDPSSGTALARCWWGAGAIATVNMRRLLAVYCTTPASVTVDT